MMENILLSCYNSARDNKGYHLAYIEIIKKISCKGGHEAIVNAVSAIRAEIDAKKKTALKKSLPAITWSGTFTKRQAECLLNYSGLICLDIDKLSEADISHYKVLLQSDPFVFFLFVSPSGAGLKIIIKVTGGHEKHLQNFLDLEEYFLKRYNLTIDKSGKDVSRLCFLSADPDAYFYVGSKIFSVPEKKPKLKLGKKKKLIEENFPDWQKIEDFTNQKAQFIEGNRNNWIHLFACNCNRFGLDEFETLNYILANYLMQDMDITEIEASVKSAFKNIQEHATKKIPGKQINKRITPQAAAARMDDKRDTDSGADSDSAKEIQTDYAPVTGEILEELSPEDFAQYYQFFDIRYERPKEDDATKKVRTLKINFLKFFHVLGYLGFRRIDIDKSHFLVHVKNNIIRESDIISIQDAFIIHIARIPLMITINEVKLHRNVILNHLMDNLNKYFDKDKLFRLKMIDAENINTDTQNEAFFYYKNKCVRVTKDKIDLIDYAEMKEKIIWDNSILTREINLREDWDSEKNVWAKFLLNVCGGDEKRALSLMSILGYSMHKYYEGKLKGIVLTDSRVSDNPEGRTGKGLICKGIGQMLNKNVDFDKVYTEINGKQFNPENERKYETCEINTKLVHIDDARPNYNVEVHYVELISGIIVKQLYKSPYKIHVKIIITTNRTIKIFGGSSTDRFLVFDLADHYNDKYSPEDEFGKWFFRDFTPEEWNLFDSFMLQCVQAYFQAGGINTYKSINLEQRYLHEQVGEELVMFLSDFPNVDFDIFWKTDFGIVPNREYDKKLLYEIFIKNTGADTKKYTQARFTARLRFYKTYNEIYQKDYQEKDGKYSQERRSHGKDLIWFVKAKAKEIAL